MVRIDYTIWELRDRQRGVSILISHFCAWNFSQILAYSYIDSVRILSNADFILSCHPLIV